MKYTSVFFALLCATACSPGEDQIFEPVRPQICGDGTVTGSETCEPPNTAVCDANCKSVPLCGNGQEDAGEDCDDGNVVSGDGCNSECLSETCGNGRLDPGESCELPNEGDCNASCQLMTATQCGDGTLGPNEQCEDGNRTAGDGCDQNCQSEACGNGIIDVEETCEPPGTATCDANCRIPSGLNPQCGDQSLNPGEECEDGNSVAGDGCDAHCLRESCGNGRLDAQEICEPPGTAFCGVDCQPPVPLTCGNGDLEAGEACDDANRLSGDGCSRRCQLEMCGNLRVDAGEDCEPPNGPHCDAHCQRIVYRCGNGRLDPGEECEDGNVIDGDTCDHECRLEYCGNGRDDLTEDCEPPGVGSCDAKCHLINLRCGNSKLEAGEECDDGDLLARDGCNGRCQLEACNNGRVDNDTECEPPGTSTCDAQCRRIRPPHCGDGTVNGIEQCEDGNLVDGDGCSSDCLLEGCGNGRLDWTEECEPPNQSNCDAHCRLKVPTPDPLPEGGEPPPQLVNGGFDLDAAGWSPRTEVAKLAFEATRDAEGSVSSGAGRIDLDYVDLQAGDGQVQGGVSQCVPVKPGSKYTLAGQYFMPQSEPGSLLAALRVAFHLGEGCAGNPTAVRQGDAASVRDAWTAFSPVAFEVPAEAATPEQTVRSVRVFVELRKTFSAVASHAFIDELVLTPEGPISVCGDGRLDVGEGCEPALLANCTSDCRVIRSCGDSIVSPPEECDPPNGTTCTPECYRVRGLCGDGKVEAGEACDFAAPGAVNCGLSCTRIQCGNGQTEPPEECDSPDRKLCTSDCHVTIPVCGDGLLQGQETCDPPDPRMECSVDCRRVPAVCGDGRVEGPEQCDYPTGPDRCQNCRRVPWCGDGKVDGSETCDPPDGILCADNCKTPPGMECQGCLAKDDKGSRLLDACYWAEGSAENGPAEGRPRAQLCVEAVECMIESGCASGGVLSCYCGPGILNDRGQPSSEPISRCLAGEQRPAACRDEFERAAETTSPGVVIQRVGDPSGASAISIASALLANGVAPPRSDFDFGPGACYVANACLVIPKCGNGILEPSEECDVADASVCNSECKSVASGCGNGRVDPGEDCDINDLFTQQRCTPECTIIPVCGDGIREGAEQCDPASADLPGPCCAVGATTCTPCNWAAVCNDGKKEFPEACDEGRDTDTCKDCKLPRNAACEECTEAKCKEQLDACESGSDNLLQSRLGSCAEVRSCMRVGALDTCAKDANAACYCGANGAGGTVDLGSCQGGTSNGPCKDLIRELSGCIGSANEPVCILGRQNDAEWGYGDANQVVNCQRLECPTECNLTP